MLVKTIAALFACVLSAPAARLTEGKEFATLGLRADGYSRLVDGAAQIDEIVIWPTRDPSENFTYSDRPRVTEMGMRNVLIQRQMAEPFTSERDLHGAVPLSHFIRYKHPMGVLF